MTTLLFCGCKYMKTYCNNQMFGKKGYPNNRFCVKNGYCTKHFLMMFCFCQSGGIIGMWDSD